jgi:hypothetical protein
MAEGHSLEKTPQKKRESGRVVIIGGGKDRMGKEG